MYVLKKCIISQANHVLCVCVVTDSATLLQFYIHHHEKDSQAH